MNHKATKVPWSSRRPADLIRPLILTVWLAVTFLLSAPVTAQPAEGADEPAAAEGAAADPGPQGVAGDPDAAGTEVERRKMSFLELLAAGGLGFMIPIGICSLFGLAIIIERLISLRRAKIIPPGFLPGLREVFQDPQRDRHAALEYCHGSDAPIARVLAVAIRKLPQGEEAVEQGIEDAGANEVGKLKRNFKVLYGISAITPMIGLLGTVWGMIEAFQIAEVTGLGSSGSASGLAGGIYTALVTTFAGLTVAIPILVFYYYFQGKIERIVAEMNDIGETFVEEYLVPDLPPSHSERSSGSGGAPSAEAGPAGQPATA